ncbi:hypothetical protein GHNINEIG_01776 [Hydrogenovibrio crunogenus]|uniref:Oligosaccharide repeat unit polymerase n=1 Tax=Hydrogenovibrio crunogenus TaxID=39765 RepID=A0A4P7P1J7_9GAMM|nr:hypothetical protein [Hydrogenovibrio crunogenus]QBZ83715.1 hypothetical protein GHNINEIG_01776 [Hydrogenovibrio crunogenus]
MIKIELKKKGFKSLKKTTINSMVPVKYLVMSFIYMVLLNVNYIFIKTSGFSLYLGGWFDFEFSWFSLFSSVIFGLLILYTFLKKINSIYSMLMSAIVFFGVLPAIVIYSYTGDVSKYYFYFFYVFLLLLFSFFGRREVKFSKKQDISKQAKVNVGVLRLIGLLGLILFFYFLFKNFSNLSFASFDEVYDQRALSKELIIGFDKYLYLFMKFGSGFAFVLLAFYFKSFFYFFMFAIIFIFDYLLGAHKFSLFVIALTFVFFVYVKYKFLSKIKLEYLFFTICFYFLLMISILIHTVKDDFLPYVVAIYDRLYFVTAGIFSRNYEYVNIHGFFYGGSSKIGSIFSAEPVDVYSAIGAYYWADGVVANTDIISDAYVNFGILGVFITLFVFWGVFNRVDDKFFNQNKDVFLPVLILYSISAVYSLGLSIALLSGGLMYLIFYTKFRRYV